MSLIPGVSAMAEKPESRYALIALVHAGTVRRATCSDCPGAAAAGVNDLCARPWDLGLGFSSPHCVVSGDRRCHAAPSDGAWRSRGIAIREGVLWPLTITAIVMSRAWPCSGSSWSAIPRTSWTAWFEHRCWPAPVLTVASTKSPHRPINSTTRPKLPSTYRFVATKSAASTWPAISASKFAPNRSASSRRWR